MIVVNLGMTKICLIDLIIDKKAVFVFLLFILFFLLVFCEVGKYLEKSGCWIKEKIGVL